MLISEAGVGLSVDLTDRPSDAGGDASATWGAGYGCLGRTTTSPSAICWSFSQTLYL
jgi:hypothetical protein